MSRPQNLESLRSLAEQIVWAAGEYGIGDTLAGATAFVGFDADKEHFTNYFLCTGTNDQTPILAAVAYVNGFGLYDIKVEAGTYDINNLTVATATEFVGGAGVIWDLPATPSLTTSATVNFEGITFQSTFDGGGHFVIGGDTYFRFCPFDLQLDCETELVPIINSNAGAANRVEFLNCTLVGGESGADYFCFFEANADMKELIIKDFLITSLVCDAAAPAGKFDLFSIPNAVDVEVFWSENVEIKGLDYTYDGCTFLTVATGGTITRVTMDGFLLHDDGVYTNTNSSFCPILSFDSNAATPTLYDVHISNWKLYGRAHPQVHGARYLKVVNMDNISASNLGADTHFNAFDCATTDSYPCDASFVNVTTQHGSLTMNAGWRNFKVSNSEFIHSRLAILEEAGGVTDQERYVEVCNCDWWYDSGVSGKFPNAFQLSYDQGIYLTRLLIQNCSFNDVTRVFNISTPDQPTFIHMDNCVVGPTIDATNPTLFSGAATARRDADDQIVWLSDCDIATDNPPCGDWNTNKVAGSFTGVNDKFDNCRFDDNGTITYSENQGIATVDSGTAVEVVNHGIACEAGTAFPSPGEVSLTGAENHLEAAQMTADTRTATQFSIRFVGGGNVSADRLVQWRARLTR